MSILNDFAVSDELREAVDSFKFEKLTPVQRETIPLLLDRKKDVVVEAVTGSVHIKLNISPANAGNLQQARILVDLQALRKRPWKKFEVGAVVLIPTRELAIQIGRVFDQIQTFIPDIKKTLLIGGNVIEEDIKTLRQKSCNVLICTPGRLEDLLTRKIDLKLPNYMKSLELLIFDEADRLLDGGFLNSIDTILSYMPRQRRTGLFSATQTQEVDELIRAGLRNPIKVTIKEEVSLSTPTLLENYYIVTEPSAKMASLIDFIKENQVKKAMIFLSTCAAVDYWSAVLPSLLKGVKIMALHGKMKHKRAKIFTKFMDINSAMLLCTDVLARGVDIPQVDWVLQMDPPTNVHAFVHRIGRTARQGTKGSSVVFLLPNEEIYVDFLYRNQKVKFIRRQDPLSDRNKPRVLLEKLRQLQLKNRSLMIKAIRAYVSYVRSYSKQECSVILRVQDLALIEIAISYGLVYLPRMPELKDCVTSSFPVIANFDPNSVPYADKQQEMERQKKLTVLQETGKWPSSEKKRLKRPRSTSESWSEKKLKKEAKRKKRAKRSKKFKNATSATAVIPTLSLSSI